MALAGVLVIRDGSSPAPTVAPQLSRGPVTPDFVGLRRTQVLCQVRDSDRRLVIDGYVENRGRRIGKRWCPGGVSVSPNPSVVRQWPAAGTRLKDGQTIRLRTECYVEPFDPDPAICL